MEGKTTNEIISWIKEQVEAGHSMSPLVWLESAQKLNVLMFNDEQNYFDLAQEVAQKEVDLINEGKNVARAKAIIRASEKFKQMSLLKAKIGRIIEHIRLAKQMARMGADEARGTF